MQTGGGLFPARGVQGTVVYPYAGQWKDDPFKEIDIAERGRRAATI